MGSPSHGTHGRDTRLSRPRRVGAAVALALVAIVLGSILASCGGGGTSGSPGASAGSAILRLASWMTLTTWDPRASAADEPLYLANVYEPLVYANPPGSAEPFTPCLATSWKVSKDGLTWTFHLRRGVTFHDGTPFTSAAVKYSLEATKKLGLGAAYMWFPITKIATPDDYTVKITTEYAAPIDRCASAMYGAWIFSPKTKGKSQKWWDAPHEAGTGPYTLVSYKPNEELVFQRYTDYWGGWKQGQFQQVVVKQVAESATQRQMLEAGEVDFADGLSRDSVPALENNPAVKIVKLHSIQNEVLMFNTQRKPLDDVKVRQALSYALPYEDILQAATNGYGEVSQGPIPRDLYPHDASVGQYTYDLTKAKQLLAEAGYPNGGFKLQMTYASDDAYGSKFAPLVKESLAKLGVTVDLQPLLFEQQWAKAKGPAKDRQDLFELVWWTGFPDGYDTLYSLFHTEADPSQPVWNMSYWSNGDYDRTIDTAFSDEPTDTAKAQEFYNQAQQMLYEQAPAAYLFDPDMVYGLNPSLTLQANALNVNYTSVFFWYQVSL
jgi:peptide/nickel transport system substrate-binding protein